jgi:hypothetical protein
MQTVVYAEEMYTNGPSSFVRVLGVTMGVGKRVS